MRYIYQGTYNDGSGKVVTSGTISVFEADGTTAASVYAAQSGGSAVNSVTSDSTDGSFVFYVDDGDYTTSQKFKITLSKTDYKSKSYDDINIFPQVSLTGTETLTNKTLTTPVIVSIYQDAGKTKLMTLPDTASDTLVALDATQTLTAKTLTEPTIGDLQNATHDHADAAGGGNTLVTPTIASLTNAQHDHSNAAGGGVLELDLQTETATTSGVTKDYTGIASTVKRITIMFDAVSTDGTSLVIVQLGDSGGFEASGYLGAVCDVSTGAQSSSNHNTGFSLSADNAATVSFYGTIVLTLQDATNNVWTISGVMGRSDTTTTTFLGGKKALTATLTQVRLTTVNGTDAFDAGAINVIYE